MYEILQISVYLYTNTVITGYFIHTYERPWRTGFKNFSSRTNGKHKTKEKKILSLIPFFKSQPGNVGTQEDTDVIHLERTGRRKKTSLIRWFKQSNNGTLEYIRLFGINQL